MAEEKQYQSLYRRYRPQGPHEVLGQEHVIRGLMGAVREGRLAHAFLFTGPRGTGKTSTARILAKMVNCELGPTAEPCSTCSQCIAIREGQHLDVVEIDAASHGGVDDARDLREKAPTAPVQGREKVYIIDEAQRLSREAFDALLKVFEEPPPGVRFVLATTEPHKMPATIVGRCQRFDFRRVGGAELAQHLMSVAEKEGFAADETAVATIVRQSEGSVRDALSLLEQAAVLGAGKVTDETVQHLLGAPPSDVQHALADAVSVGDAKGMFEIINRLVQEGQDLRHVTSETLGHFRDLMLAKSAPDQAGVLDVSEDEAERLRAQAAKFSQAELARVIGLLLAAQTDMRWTTSPRLTLELALVRATIPETDAQPHALISRIERLERVAGIQPGDGGPEPAATTTSSVPTNAASQKSQKSRKRREAPEAPKDELAPATESAAVEAEAVASPVPVLGAGTSAIDVSAIRGSWGSLVQHLRSGGKAVLPSFLEVATPAAFDGETLELAFPPDRRFGVTKVEERESELRAALRELFGIEPRIRCVVREAVAGIVVDEDPPLPEEEALARLRAELGAEPTTEGGS
ncbi:MAG TPA: DNA polymerase III subunit gamma/tau [Actinomycetota bacterium]|nr:DNA polymerase III subunit gamma/tau [Actinomycetota bacterium]